MNALAIAADPSGREAGETACQQVSLAFENREIRYLNGLPQLW
jgi:hypothetical protein